MMSFLRGARLSKTLTAMETFLERTRDVYKQDAVKKRNETPDTSASGGASRLADITH